MDFIRSFLDDKGYPPTVRDIQRGCDISSTSVVDYNLNILERLGTLRRDPEVSRGIELLEGRPKQSVPVPLETGASGLLVFTQDWRVARKLTEDASVLEHEFMVEVAGTPTPEQLALLNQRPGGGATQLPHIKVSLSSSQGGRAKLRFAFKGAHLGLVDHLCQRVGWQLLGMRRQRISRVALAHLPQGQWRYLGPHERF